MPAFASYEHSMKTITFTVQIQADIHERPGKKEKIATDLCQYINRILTKYDGMLGGAQIMPNQRASKPPRRRKIRAKKPWSAASAIQPFKEKQQR
jgi:hypothetical protein